MYIGFMEESTLRKLQFLPSLIWFLFKPFAIKYPKMKKNSLPIASAIPSFPDHMPESDLAEGRRKNSAGQPKLAGETI